MTCEYQLVSARLEPGAMQLTVRSNTEEFAVALNPSEGGTIVGWGRIGERFIVKVAQNWQQKQEGSLTLVTADWHLDIECDKYQRDEIQTEWAITELMASQPNMPYLESFRVSERFITLTLRQQDGTFSRARLDRGKAGPIFWGMRDGVVALKRDLEKGAKYEASLVVTTLPYQQRTLLRAFGMAEVEDVPAVQHPQAAD